MSIEPYLGLYEDYSRIKALREIKALKLLQLLESGKLLEIVLDSGACAGQNDQAAASIWLQIKSEIEKYLND
jgi:hypothetical protein